MKITEKIIRGLLVKEELEDPKVVEFRRGECGKCDMRVDKKCGICKCFITIKTESKVHLEIEKMEYRQTHCPLGIWNDKDVANIYRMMDGKTPLK